MSALTDIVIDDPAGTVNIPEAALKVIFPDETEAASVNLNEPLYRYTFFKFESADTPILCNVMFVTTAGAADLFANVYSARFAAAWPATRAEPIGDVADKETERSVPVTPVTTEDPVDPETGEALTTPLVIEPKYPAAGVMFFDNWNLIRAAFVSAPK